MMRIVQAVGVGLLAIVGVVFVGDANVSAAPFSWSEDELVFGEPERVDYLEEGCRREYFVPIGGALSSRQGTVCVYDRGSWRYGIYSERTGPTYLPRWTNYFVVGFGTSETMYKVTNMPTDNLVHIPNSHNLIRNVSQGLFTNGQRRMDILKDLPSSLTVQAGIDEITYTYSAEWEPVLVNAEGDQVITKGSGISDNGRWLALEDDRIGFILKDVETNELRLFSDYRHRYGVGSDANIHFVVSDDGNYVAMFDRNAGHRVHKLSNTCGISASSYDELLSRYSVDTFSNCPTDDGVLAETLLERYGYPAYRSVRAHAFEAEGRVLYFLVCSLIDSDGEEVFCERLPLYASGYTPSDPDPEPSVRQLEYLALGDSYSSGEGDIGRKPGGGSYYLPGTERGGQCHLSSRSYPFLLRGRYEIAADRMASVACSGAQVMSDYIGVSDNYLGQNKDLEKEKEKDRILLREEALESFRPSIVKQLDFVRKYQPKIITFTGGGNDVGFADILKYCAKPVLLVTPFTCEYAKPGSLLNTMLHDSIDTQRTYTKMLIDGIKEASPDSEIILIGYPSFIDHSSFMCFLDGGMLDFAEKRMLNGAVNYMNSMLQSVAFDTGISFVDIENALNGGRLCESSLQNSYVTGLLSSGLVALDGDPGHQPFHPNAKGHQRIAQVIIDSGVFQGAISVEDSDYQPSSTAIKTQRGDLVDEKTVSKGGLLSIRSLTGSFFKINSMVKALLHSDPVEMGTIRADVEGNVSLTVDTKDLPAGNHVLVLEGVDDNDEPVRYYQFVEIVEIEETSKAMSDVNPRAGTAGSKLAINSEIEPVLSHKPQPLLANDHQDEPVLLRENPSSTVAPEAEQGNSNSALLYLLLICIILTIGATLYAKNHKTKT